MKAVEDFLPFVTPFCAGVPEPLAETQIVLAAREFCERTRMWRETDSWPTTTTAEDVLCVPPGSTLYEIDRVWFNDRALEPEAYSSRVPTDDGAPLVVAQVQPNMLRLRSDNEGKFTVAMFLKPTPDADELPDFLFDNHVETLAYGALARLLVMPARPWTALPIAAGYRQAFAAKLDTLSTSHVRGQQRAPLRTKARYC